MSIAAANSIEIAYETFGRRQDPGLVLIMGLGERLEGCGVPGFCRRIHPS